MFEFACLRKRLFTFYHREFQALLDACSSTREREILYLALKIACINIKHTQSRAENSLFQFCLTITKPFSPIYLEEIKKSLSVSGAVSHVIMRVYKPTVAYKLVQLHSKNPKGAP